MKKIISLLLSAIMLLSVCITAFAYTDDELIAKYNLSEKAVSFMKEHGVDIQIFENAPVYEGFPDRYNTSIEGFIMQSQAYGFTDEQIGDYIKGLVTTKMIIVGGPYDNTGRKTVYPELVPFYIHGERINHEDTAYPLITSKGEVYIPMTYEYARMLKLSTSWTEPVWSEGSEEAPGVFSIYRDSEVNAHYAEYQKADNTSKEMYAYQTDVITYSINVNGKQIEIDENEVLNFRGVTYFRLGGRYIKDEFGLDYTHDANGVHLIIKD